MVFVAVAVTTLTSGLSSVVLADRELAKLSSIYYVMMRKLARGKASFEVILEDGRQKNSVPYQCASVPPIEASHMGRLCFLVNISSSWNTPGSTR